MKKIWSAIIVVLLVISCCITCIAQLANNLFQEDLGKVVMREVNLNGQLEQLFKEVELNVPQENIAQFESLKKEIENNTEIQNIISVAGRDMLDDIVHTQADNHDIKKVVSDMIYSYDEELTKVLDGFVSKEDLHKNIDNALEVLPVQMVYDTAVESFQESIPQSYLKIMKIVNVFSVPAAFYIAVACSILLAAILVILNLKQLQWTFSIGVVGIISGGVLLVMGQIAPSIFERLALHLDDALTQLSNADFHIMIQYGIAYLIVGAISLLLYFTNARKKAHFN